MWGHCRLACRHPKWQRRLQGANPCADHGRNTVRGFDPQSCTVNDRADLQARSLALLREPPYRNPDWNNTLRWQSAWNKSDEAIKNMWAVQAADFATWENFTPTNAEERRLKELPFVNYFPDFLDASWEASATVEGRNGSIEGPSEEWKEMLAVCSSLRACNGVCSPLGALSSRANTGPTVIVRNRPV